MNESTLADTRPAFRRQKPKLVFRVYYDISTKRCLFKSCEPEVNADYPHIEVDYATYESIGVCDNYQVIENNISKIKITTSHKKLIPTANGKFATTKNNMIFVVDKNFPGEKDYWDYIRYDG